MDPNLTARLLTLPALRKQPVDAIAAILLHLSGVASGN